MNSKQKGKRGELQAAKAIAETFGAQACRGVQFKGTPDSPDVATDIPGLHFEVKFTERFNVYDALDQSAEDAGDQLPVVLHRRKNAEWVICFYLEDAPEFAKIIHNYMRVNWLEKAMRCELVESRRQSSCPDDHFVETDNKADA